MHLAPLIQDLAVILAVAGLMSLICQKIRQPVVLGYIISGMIVGPYTPPFQLVTDAPSIRTLAELGVIFLMFSLGLEFSFRKLARVGASAGITAGTEVLFFVPVGYGFGKLLGWGTMDSIFLGAMLSISSTTIIIKALDELKLRTHRFAELIFGVLIVEDLIAILLLVALTSIATSGTISGLALLSAAWKLTLVVGGWFIVGYFAVPRFIRYVGGVGNNELLTLVSLGLCLGLVVFASSFNYSTALGAFIMGSILAESPLLHQIESRMESLRDLFGAVFFVSIGMLIDPVKFWEYKGTIALLCIVTIVGKILSTGLGALISGQTFRNSIRVGFGLAQIGEFSFIIAGLGLALSVTSDFLYPVAVAVSLVTTFTTPYLIKASVPLSEKLEASLPAKAKQLLNHYALWNEGRRTAAVKRLGFYRLIARWLINGLTVSVVFVLCSEILVSYLRTRGIQPEVLRLAIAWISSIVLSSPFIWGMFATFKRYAAQGVVTAVPQRSVALYLFRFLTLIWIAALSAGFFPARYVVILTCTVLVVLLVVFYKHLERSYHWFEKRFLASFEEQESGRHTADTPRLAPWDAHLVRIQVHPNSEFSGKKISEIQLRNKYGINIVSIQRGLESIVAPRPEETIFPNDELLVLGTDENIGEARFFLEGPRSASVRSQASAGYELRQFRISPEARSILGATIRNSGIRERFGAMVVGVERERKRIVNPDSGMTLHAEDTLWVVGPTENLLRLQQEIMPEPKEA